MVHHEKKTLSDIVSSQQSKNHQRVKGFDNKHFLIHYTQFLGVEEVKLCCIIVVLGRWSVETAKLHLFSI
jgi:hypothetical protein